jgi:hypothetical protein
VSVQHFELRRGHTETDFPAGGAQRESGHAVEWQRMQSGFILL